MSRAGALSIALLIPAPTIHQGYARRGRVCRGKSRDLRICSCAGYRLRGFRLHSIKYGLYTGCADSLLQVSPSTASPLAGSTQNRCRLMKEHRGLPPHCADAESPSKLQVAYNGWRRNQPHTLLGRRCANACIVVHGIRLIHSADCC